MYAAAKSLQSSLQYSCLENPMGGGAWWAAVHGVARSRTRPSDFTFTFHFHDAAQREAPKNSLASLSVHFITVWLGKIEVPVASYLSSSSRLSPGAFV